MMKRFLLFLAMLLISSGFSLTLPAGPKLSVVGKSRNDNAKKHVRFLTTCVAATAASTKKTVPTSTKLLNSVFNKKNTVTWLLAFMAGFMNIVCSIRFGSPVLMMTGNYIALGRSLAKQAWIDVSFLLCLVINYCSGFVFSRAIESNVAKTTITSATVLALFAMADAVAFKFPGSRWQGVPLAIAFGLINSHATKTTGSVTTMMTGHMQNLSTVFSDLLKGSVTDAQRSSSVTSAGILIAFISGITIGATYLTAPMLSGTAVFSSIGIIYALLSLLG